jgi:hypothetical protein
MEAGTQAAVKTELVPDDHSGAPVVAVTVMLPFATLTRVVESFDALGLKK